MATTARELAQRTQKLAAPKQPEPQPEPESEPNDTNAAYPEFVSAGTTPSLYAQQQQQQARVEEVNDNEEHDYGREDQLAEDAAHIEAITQREIAVERADDAAVREFLARRRDASEAVRERALRALTDAPPAKRPRATLPIVVRRTPTTVLEGYDDVVSSDDEPSTDNDKQD